MQIHGNRRQPLVRNCASIFSVRVLSEQCATCSDRDATHNDGLSGYVGDLVNAGNMAAMLPSKCVLTVESKLGMAQSCHLASLSPYAAIAQMDDPSTGEPIGQCKHECRDAGAKGKPEQCWPDTVIRRQFAIFFFDHGSFPRFRRGKSLALLNELVPAQINLDSESVVAIALFAGRTSPIACR